MSIINNLKLWALLHALNNMEDKVITDMIESYQRKEFGERSDKAIEVTSDKLMRIALELNRRVKK